jgi:hypothetical protein
MTAKLLLRVTAVAESLTGAALLLSPSLVVTVLLGATLDRELDALVGRIAGAALLSLGLACWWASNDDRDRHAAGVVAAVLLYDILVIVLLVYALAGIGLAGVGFWPAAIAHAVLALWCVAALSSQPLASPR